MLSIPFFREKLLNKSNYFLEVKKEHLGVYDSSESDRALHVLPPI